MTEIGVYILGATALVVLTAAGIALGNSTIIACAVIASGFAYASQFFAALYGQTGAAWAQVANGVGLLVVVAAWLTAASQLL